MLSARRLEILHAVLAAGSVNAAARNLNYSAATISQHLAALARETGLVLFEKEGRGIAPTDAALHLAEQAQSVLADFARLERTVADLRAGQGEHLALACFASAAEELIPEVVRAVRELRPNITTEVSLNEPVDGRGRRRPDLDIRTEPVDGAEIRLEGYRRHELLTEELLAVLPGAHPLAGARSVALGELRTEPWIDHDIYDSPTGQIILGACTAAGFAPRYVARLDNHHAALNLVRAGIGITVLPRLAVPDPPGTLVAVPLTPAVRRRIVLHARLHPRRGGLVTAAAARLRAAAGDWAARHGEEAPGEGGG
ncbi:LysR family transcriptional regulator [Streptomyces sp. WMMB303]|uniref:LysR family transcriptional regulator n=1 Tax=Streptomyces sp. WMMB303 TaxID=3034154 RepID=UPI0023EB52F6|nr:LysR family transcriptional regulator [Streptomyces sp. WMMB303]MDF4248922.1 LysR family transcriptional regulator [Streptomyces sp. WMMB303]